MPPDSDDLDAYRARLEADKRASLGQVLVKAARLLNEQGIARMRRDPRYEGMSLRHLSLMPHLDLAGTRITTLAARMDVTKQAVGQLVTEMESVGMVERTPDPEDGRAKLVRFTAFGRESLLNGIAVLGSIERELAEALGQAELTRLRRGLLKIVEVLEDAETDQD